MRKIFITAVIVLTMAFTGCGSNESQTKRAPDKQPVPEQKKIETQAPKAPSADLSLVGEGRLPGIDFGIGASAKEVTAKLGKPNEEDFYEGGYYLDYGKVVILTDGDETYNGKITSISVAEGEIFGVKIGMKPSEVSAELGQPSYEGTNKEEGFVYQLRYDVKGYSLTFTSEKPGSPVLSASLAPRI